MASAANKRKTPMTAKKPNPSMAPAAKKRKTSMAYVSQNNQNQTSRISKKNDGLDRFGELPDDILVHILSFLPIFDAVRTVLLYSFGNLWTQIPCLIFDDGETLSSKKPIGKRFFTRFIRHVLKLHKKTTIDRFGLRLRRFDLSKEEDGKSRDWIEVEKWINFALDTDVKALDLQFDRGADGSVLHRVFTSRFLVTLKLSNCVIEHEHLSQVHLGCLRELWLFKVLVGNEEIKELLSRCPSLKKLDFKDPCMSRSYKLCVTNPNFEMLDVYVLLQSLDCPSVKVLNLVCLQFPQTINVPLAREVSIQLKSSYNMVESVLKKFRNVEVFKVSDDCFTMLRLEELDFLETRWKRWCYQSHVHHNQLLGICKLLRSSPHLEELTLYAVDWRVAGCKEGICSCEEHKPMEFSSHTELSSPCVITNLRIVTLLGYKAVCRQGVLHLANFLLKSAVNLVKLVIIPNEDYSRVAEVLDFDKQLSSLPRASANARIVWQNLTPARREWLKRNSF